MEDPPKEGFAEWAMHAVQPILQPMVGVAVGMWGTFTTNVTNVGSMLSKALNAGENCAFATEIFCQKMVL